MHPASKPTDRERLWTPLRNVPAYLLISSSISLCIFFSGLDNAFASDDWPAILRNSTLTWQTLPEWFTGLRAGWYRPIHDVFVYLCWRLFYLNPVGYHLVSISVYALVAAGVGVLVHILTTNRRMSIVSVVLFSVFATHAEPVLWFAATNELFAGLFVLGGVTSYLLFRKTNHYGLVLVSAMSGLLAFATKETSLFYPIVLILYDLIRFVESEPKHRRWSFFLPFLPIALLWGAFLVFRIPMGSSYADTVDVVLPGLVKNTLYYILIGVFALPNNYAFFASIPQWRSVPLLPVTVLVLSTSVIVALGFVWQQCKILANRQVRRSLAFTLAWSVAALGPVLFITTERAFFMSSIGVVSTFAILLVGAWEAAKEGKVRLKGIIVIAFALYFGLNTYVLAYRSTWFGRSADLNQAILGQLGQQIETLPGECAILIANLPDHTQFTFTFRNTFPSATRLLYGDVDVIPVLDRELVGKSAQQQRDFVNQITRQVDCSTVFWYRDGALLLQGPNSPK